MATIRIKREHSLDNAKVREEVQQLADKLAGELDASYDWQGDCLTFHRSGARGHIGIGEGSLEIEIKLGMLLAPFKGKVEKTITDYLDERLA